MTSTLRPDSPSDPPNCGVFAHIDLEGTRPTVLTQRATMTPQAIGELVDDLVRLGYVGKRPDPEDGRAKLVTLTVKGHTCMKAAFTTIEQIESRLRALLGGPAFDSLQKGLVKIIGKQA